MNDRALWDEMNVSITLSTSGGTDRVTVIIRQTCTDGIDHGNPGGVVIMIVSGDKEFLVFIPHWHLISL